MMQVLFHGTSQEASEFVAAMQAYCECDLQNNVVCNGHKEMKGSQQFVDRLLFARRIRTTLLAEEMRLPG